jgi:hypothetical protein
VTRFARVLQAADEARSCRIISLELREDVSSTASYSMKKVPSLRDMSLDGLVAGTTDDSNPYEWISLVEELTCSHAENDRHTTRRSMDKHYCQESVQQLMHPSINSTSTARLHQGTARHCTSPHLLASTAECRMKTQVVKVHDDFELASVSSWQTHTTPRSY